MPPAQSHALAACFSNATLLVHERGHIVPSRADETSTVLDFMRGSVDNGGGGADGDGGGRVGGGEGHGDEGDGRERSGQSASGAACGAGAAPAATMTRVQRDEFESLQVC